MGLLDKNIGEDRLDKLHYVPDDGNFLVGDGAEWVTESGNTARTSLGLGTGDSPTFATETLSALNASLYVSNTGEGATDYPTVIFQHQGTTRAAVFWDEANVDLILRSYGPTEYSGDISFQVGGGVEKMRLENNGVLTLTNDLYVTGAITNTESIKLKDGVTAFTIQIRALSVGILADRVLTIDMQDADKTLVISGNAEVDQGVHVAGSPVFAGETITNCAVLGSNSAVFQPNADSTTFFQILDADGDTPIFNVDSTNEGVCLGGSNPTDIFQINYNTDASTKNIIFYDESTGPVEGDLQGGIKWHSSDSGAQTGIQAGLYAESGEFGNTMAIVLKFGNSQDEKFRFTHEGSFRLIDDTGNQPSFFGQQLTTDIYQGSGSADPAVSFRNRDSFPSTNGNCLYVQGGANSADSYIIKCATGILGAAPVDRFIINGLGNIGIGSEAMVPETILEIAVASPYLTLHNTTHEDSDGGRESRLNFKGEQTGGEKTTLARIEVSHDGSADDEKGKLVISTNDGSDTDTPTQRIKIDSAGLVTISGEVEAGGTTTKSKLTSIGGYAVKLTNNTGVNSVEGQLVEADNTDENSYKKADANATDVIGAVHNAGIADGSEVWIVIAGIAEVLLDAGGCVHHDRLISSATAGSADVWNVGGAVATHFQEIGHAIETVVGAGLAKAVLHFL